MKNKKGAMELSMGTMVVIALSIAVLVIGMIFIKKIMCSGIILTDQISKSAENSIKGLFNTGDEEVVCLGEGEKDVVLGGGGNRKVFCIVKSNDNAQYNFKNIKITECNGMTASNTQKYECSKIKLVNHGDKENINVVAGKQKIIPIAILRVPEDINKGTFLTMNVDVSKSSSSNPETHRLYLNFEPVGAFKSTIC